MKRILALICVIMLSIFLLFLINLNRTYKDSNAINVLGRQRMLTQMMAKDTGRIYILNSILSEGSYSSSPEEVQVRLSETLKELERSKNEYKSQYNTIKKGHIIVDEKIIKFERALKRLEPVFKENDAVWIDFEKSVDTVLKEKDNSQAAMQAIKYINENNEKLLDYSNSITNIVLKHINDRSLRMFYAIIALIVLILINLTMFIRNAYRDLFIPISELNKGMSQLGIAVESPDLQEEKSNLALTFSEVNMVFEQLSSLKMLIENINKNIPFKQVLEYIFNTFSKYIPYTHIGVALIEDGGKMIKASYGVSDENHKNLVSRLKGIEAYLECTSLKKIVKNSEERIIDDLEEYIKGKPLKEYNKILLEEGIRSSISFPLINNDKTIGIIFFSSNRKNIYKKEHIVFLKTLANSIVLSLEKDILIQDMVVSSTFALAKLTEERDNETGEHLYRMSKYSRMIAQFLSKEDKYEDIIDIDYIDDIERFSPLHDIGKVAIRDDILLKPGRLSKEEFEIMKTHTSYGAKVLKTADEVLEKKGRSVFKMAIEIAEGHHEKWDGSGYPYGRKGEEIPLSARIVAIADVFDALTSRRPYKEPFSFEESIKIILESSEKHFDPFIVDVFIKNIHVVKSRYLSFRENIAV